jgi:glycerol-3-phosphate dehydrogenase
MERYDLLIIGGGVIGSSIARELSRYRVSIALVERESDVACWASGKNSGVVHGGFDPLPGTLKAKLNVEGNRLFGSICRELDVPFKRVGKFVVATERGEIGELKSLKKRARLNGVPEVEIITGKELLEREPNVRGVAAMFVPTAGIISPYLLNIALVENAIKNGVRVFLNTEVKGIIKKKRGFVVRTNDLRFFADWVINAAGIHSDRIARMVGIGEYRLYPCRGEYHVLDKRVSGLVHGMIYPIPPKGSGGKGIHITPTIDGNILLGPSAEYVRSKSDFRTTMNVAERLLRETKSLCPRIERKDIITSFAGMRAKLCPPSRPGFTDFVIEERPEQFINLVGIESPGLSAAPAIARMVACMVDKREGLRRKGDFDPKREGIKRVDGLSFKERNTIVHENPDYGEIICRCEGVSRAEIIQAINNPLGVRTLRGIRYRARAMMGRCQGGYCMPKIVEIINEFYPEEEITLGGTGSYLFSGRTRSG